MDTVEPASAQQRQSGSLRMVGLGLLVLAAMGATVVVLAHHADASHFRGGTLYAVPDPATGPDSVRFEGRLFFRGSYFGGCTVGATPGLFAFDQNIYTAGTARPFGVKVVSCNFSEDWAVTKIIDPSTGLDGVPFTYSAPLDPSGAPWVAYWEAAARLDAVSPNYHVNNPNHGWRLETTVDLSGTADNPPRPFVPPIVQCPTAGACHIPIPEADSDATDPITFRFSTTAEATCHVIIYSGYCPDTNAFYQPGDPACGACGTAAMATVDATGGALDWNTVGAFLSSPGDRTLYSTQVMVQDGREKVPMDFLIRLVDGVPPQWVVPPTPCDDYQMVIQGTTLTFPVQAMSPVSANTVTISAIEIPPGAAFGGGAAANPSSGTFTWPTTGVPIGQYLAVFFAEDNLGLTAPTCVVHIKVVPPPTPEFTFLFTQTAPADLTYDPVQFTDATPIASYFASASKSWAWAFNDPNDPSTGVGNAPLHTYTDNAVYPACMTLTLTLSSPWSGTVCHNVPVNNRPPEPRLRATVLAGPNMRFTDSGGDRDGTVVAWAWDFGDLTTGTGSPVGHLYAQEGVYTVCITETDNDGATGQACQLVHITMPESRDDSDLDGVADTADNCPTLSNPDQADTDHNGIGDACQEKAPEQGPSGAPPPTPVPGRGADTDLDGILDPADNCPSVANHDQLDLDGDGIGDACDADIDGDGVPNAGVANAILDNCPTANNPLQQDSDRDGLGDACDTTSGLSFQQIIDAAKGGGGVAAQPETPGPSGLQALVATPMGLAGLVVMALLLATGAVGLALWAVRRNL